MKTYYKIIHYNKKRYTYTSINNNLKYSFNKWTTPRKGYWQCLFIFKTFEDAVRFIDVHRYNKRFYGIFECKTRNVFGPPRVYVWPQGTLCTNKVKLVCGPI